ncbi:MAG TPA: ABC transporter ATP-binding protein [Gemmatimonadaceae bacterium]|jgi:molybdopterin-binding protein
MIAVQGLTARLGDFALEDITFTVPRGSYGVVIGPAGAGKTTLLESIAGLIPLKTGTVRLGDVDVTRVAPERRGLGLVYQHAYLFPHLTVRQNVAYGAADAALATEMTERFGLQLVGDRDVRSLSGGERQLVALARTLARRPNVLLLDEPFAALDPRSRAAVRREVRTIYFERQFTVLHVTHDFAEAGLVGDVAILLDKGRLIQAGEPAQLFRRPATAYVANFLGAENIYAGTARPIRAITPDWTDAAEGEFAEHPLAFDTGALTLYALGDAVPGKAHAVIRAEDVMLSTEAIASSVRNQFRGRVIEIVAAGALSKVTVNVSGTPIISAVTTRAVQELGLAPGREVVASFKATAIHIC